LLRQIIYPIAFLLLFLALFVWSEHAFSPVFQQCVSQQEQDNSGNAAKDNPSAFGRLASVYVRCSGDFANRNGNGITALATIIIAAFTGTLWIATSRQARLARESLTANRRAFIFPESFRQTWDPPDPITNQFNWRFSVRWRNVGTTATRKLRTYSECEVRNSLLPQGYNFSYDEKRVVGGLIGPYSEMFGGSVPNITPVTPQDIADAQVGKKFIYLWGWVRYFDVFPGSPEHVTHFCWLITCTGDPMKFAPNTPTPPPTPGALAFGFLQAPEGNYTDE
jgi:hypothetical protein